MAYERLTRDERYQIGAFRTSGLGVRAIARQLLRDPASISRELRRSEIGNYLPAAADALAKKRASSRNGSRRKIDGELLSHVQKKLEEDWSPEQISGRLRQQGSAKAVSMQTIYKFVEEDRIRGGLLFSHLRILRKERKDRKKPGWQPFAVKPDDRESIEKRPAIVEKRERLGDYERDTVFGKLNGVLLLTLVDRTSRLVKISRIEKKSSELVHQATVERLKNEPVETITNDNGPEFIKHARTAASLSTKIYFSHPYRSWERGSNENMNGLIRQYFPKSKPIPSADCVAKAESILNSRPRKCLGYRTPLEVHRELKSSPLR